MSNVQPRPIPALYTVYILRSVARHSSLYIGSTPNPPRRLKQHNGVVQGGASRTSRPSLRPWEMIGLVSGFPGAIAALKFEWALTNPHLSLHIPKEARITTATQDRSPAKKGKGGRRRKIPRPRASMASVVANLHLLLGVRSFRRWPLKLHLFVEELGRAWDKWCASTAAATAAIGAATERNGLEAKVVRDYDVKERKRKRKADALDNKAGAIRIENDDDGAKGEERPRGIYALPLDHTPIKDYVARANEVFAFEREGNCVVCGENLLPGKGIYAMCHNTGCTGVGHLDCWSRHLLQQKDPVPEQGRDEVEDEDIVLPVSGSCPSCKGRVEWALMMRELTLRTRGPEEVAKLLKVKKVKSKGKFEEILPSDEEDLW